MASGMTMPVFEVGKCYCATGVMQESPRQFLVCIGREGSEVCFGFCNAVKTTNVRCFPGLDREFGQFFAPNGHQYNVSAALPLDSDTAMRIIQSMEGLRYHD